MRTATTTVTEKETCWKCGCDLFDDGLDDLRSCEVCGIYVLVASDDAEDVASAPTPDQLLWESEVTR